MIQMGTILEVADNSGARKIACIRMRGGSAGRYAGLGDVITASVKEAAPDSPFVPLVEAFAGTSSRDSACFSTSSIDSTITNSI